jgi:hypothetical protein
MNSLRLTALTCFAAMASLAPTAMADEWNKRTVLTINEAVQLPNVVLQPGTYTFKLVDSSADRHIVQVFDKDEKHIITTILAIPNYRLTPTGKSAFKFWEAPAGQPPAMRAWFYPGDNFGQEFAYPKDMSAQIASNAKMAVPTTTASTAEDYKSAPVTATTENGSSSKLDTQTYTQPQTAEVAPPPPPPAPVAAEPAPPPVQEPVAAPTPQQPSPAPADLPHTASSMPLIGLIGAISLLGFYAVRAKSVR